MAPLISRTRPILCAVLDGAALGTRPGGHAEKLFAAGVDWIQLRDRSMPIASLVPTAQALVAAARAHPGCRILVNRRVDVAWAAGADGVHLGFDALEAPEVRSLLGEEALVGVSLHSAAEVLAEAARHRSAACDYAHLAPIWSPISKLATRPPLGLGALARACASGLPVLAQGGVDLRRAGEAIAVGAAGIAVTGLLSQAVDAAAIAGELRHELDRAHRPQR